MEIMNTILAWIGCIAIAIALEYAVFKLILHISNKRAEKHEKEVRYYKAFDRIKYLADELQKDPNTAKVGRDLYDCWMKMQ